MKKIENIMKCCNRNDELFRTYIACLLQLKHHNEVFQKVQQQLRVDYLVRGICEREVDGIIRESKEYKMYDLPKVLRWDFLRENPSMIESVCTKLFGYERLNLSYEEWGNVIRCIETD
ncbi:group-specific protein [Bacillus pseudomycoides]|uniref:group-specific protein n=1 Tax=Bacillus pseudomycoides TaxID=64104 RepID=UPI000BEBA268|nr:group-specific protein [Bacillus pseudomycoides]PEE44590.1 group-specific protein [Bacillus pseudomycoides]PEI91219.1 group-specific protein [Bacillus pseudomycoides]PGA89088.1 group-specific protein [Bacillus pseudomycoides]PHF46693.1 group-specific protein [Bacillus pseudomycoides]